MSLHGRTMKVALDMRQQERLHDVTMGHKKSKWSMIQSRVDESTMEITFYSLCGNCEETP